MNEADDGEGSTEMSQMTGSASKPSIGMLQRLCRMLPGYTGLGRIANARLLRALAPAEGVELTRLWDGSSIYLKPNDLLSRVIHYFGDFDRKVSWIVRRVLRPGDAVIDIGANVGVISLPCAKAVGPGGVVHSFEPQPELAALLRRSAVANGYSWLHVHEMALSDRDGTAELWVPIASSDGYATLHRDSEQPARAVQVPLRHSGEYLTSLGLGSVRLLKIDVEGHEVPILSGAREFLEAKRPDVVLFEVTGTEEFSAREITKLLGQHGYDSFLVPHQFWFKGCIPADAADAVGCDARDGVAIARGPAQEELRRRLAR